MYYILDIVLLLIFIIAIFIGYHKGFIKSVLGLFGTIIVLTITFLLVNPVSNILYNNGIRDMTIKKIEGSVNLNATSENEIIPKNVKIALKMFGIDEKELENDISNKTNDFKTVLVNKIAEPIGKAFSTLISYIILIVLTFIIVKVLTLFSGVFDKIPIVKHLNKTLGIVMGVINAILLTFILVMFVKFVAPFNVKNESSILNPSNIEKTIVFKHLYNFAPNNDKKLSLSSDKKLS